MCSIKCCLWLSHKSRGDYSFYFLKREVFQVSFDSKINTHRVFQDKTSTEDEVISRRLNNKIRYENHSKYFRHTLTLKYNKLKMHLIYKRCGSLRFSNCVLSCRMHTPVKENLKQFTYLHNKWPILLWRLITSSAKNMLKEKEKQRGKREYTIFNYHISYAELELDTF